MEDVGKSPPASAIAIADSSSFNQLDGWIETLMQCKQLSELDVQRLCEKVRPRRVCVVDSRMNPSDGFGSAYAEPGVLLCFYAFRLANFLARLEKSFKTSRTSNQWYVPCGDRIGHDRVANRVR